MDKRIKLTHIDNTPRRSEARDLLPKKSKAITLTDLEDIIDEIRELEETSDHLHTEALEEKLRYIRKALIHVQVQQKSYMEAIELYTQNLNKSIG